MRIKTLKSIILIIVCLYSTNINAITYSSNIEDYPFPQHEIDTTILNLVPRSLFNYKRSYIDNRIFFYFSIIDIGLLRTKVNITHATLGNSINDYKNLYSNALGLHFGESIYFVYKKSTFSTGFYLRNRNATYAIWDNHFIDNYISEYKERLSYFSLPINYEYNLFHGIHAKIGLHFDKTTKGMRVRNNKTGTRILTKNYRRNDIILNAALCFVNANHKKTIGFRLEFGYNKGLINRVSSSDIIYQEKYRHVTNSRGQEVLDVFLDDTNFTTMDFYGSFTLVIPIMKS